MTTVSRSKLMNLDNDFSIFVFLLVSKKGVRNSEQSSDQNRNQIYCIERDHVPRLDYNEVMNQSKESMELIG